MWLWAVELRREESRRRFQDRVRPAQLAHLPLQLRDPGLLRRVHPGRLPLLDPGLLDPVPQRVGVDPQLLTDTPAGGVDRQALTVLVDQVAHEANRTRPNLVGILPRCRHDSHLPWARSLHQSQGGSLPGMLVELSVVEQRYRAVLAVIGDGVPVVQVARRFEVWRQGVREGGRWGG